MKTQTILLLDQQKNADIKRLQEKFASDVKDTKVLQLLNKDEFENFFNQCKDMGSPFRVPAPTLIIVDIDFPTSDDGLEVLDTINRSTHLSNIPLLVFTNNDDKDVVANCYVRGANGYYLKPSTEADFNNILHKLKARWQRLAPRSFGYSYKAV